MCQVRRRQWKATIEPPPLCLWIVWRWWDDEVWLCFIWWRRRLCGASGYGAVEKWWWFTVVVVRLGDMIERKSKGRGCDGAVMIQCQIREKEGSCGVDESEASGVVVLRLTTAGGE
ncbi:hypothetical protein ACFE04_021764 [Oxalis oulophora]